MSVKEKMRQAVMAAMKIHDQQQVDALRFLISLIDKKELQLPPGEMTEAEEINVLRKELKNKEESKEMFAKADRKDLVTGLYYEIELVKQYLPVEMAREEIEKIVDEIIESGANNFGMIMGQVMKKIAGKASGETVTNIVKEKIEKL